MNLLILSGLRRKCWWVKGGGGVLFFRNFHCTMSLFVYCTAYSPRYSPSEIGRTQVLSFSLISFFRICICYFLDEKNRSRWQQKSNLTSQKKDSEGGKTKSMYTIGSSAEFLLSSRTRTRRFSRALESVRRVSYSLSLFFVAQSEGDGGVYPSMRRCRCCVSGWMSRPRSCLMGRTCCPCLS